MWHLGDIAKSCGDLSQGEMGAYDLLLDWHYANEKPLPLAPDKLYRIGRAITKTERKNVDSVVAELFTKGPHGYTHKRAAEEIEKASAQSEHNRIVGKLGGRPRKNETKVVPKNNPSGFDSETKVVPKNNPSQTPDSKEQKKDQKKKQPQAALPEIPDWLDSDAWHGFVAMRTKERHPLTTRAAQLVLAELTKHRATGADPNAILDQSTRNGWRDVFAIKPNGNANGQTQRTQPRESLADTAAKRYAAIVARTATE